MSSLEKTETQTDLLNQTDIVDIKTYEKELESIHLSGR